MEVCSSAVAVDMSEAQTALLELKLAAIRSLCYEDFLVLLGEAKDEGGRWYIILVCSLLHDIVGSVVIYRCWYFNTALCHICHSSSRIYIIIVNTLYFV